MALDSQVHIYSVDTSAFYNGEESKISKHIYESQREIWRLEGLDTSDEELREEISALKTDISQEKLALKSLLSQHEGVRYLKPECLSTRRTISLFESTLTRTLHLSKDIINDELILVRVFYFDVFKDLVKFGFYCNGEKYVFFTASAGQIRTKKNVFIKESILKKHHDTLFCGMSLNKINSMGGVNPNKYLAYLALCNSATDRWDKFDITKCVVVDDVETIVTGEVDYIHPQSWEIERRTMGVPINHTDGCGMMLPKVSKKNFMVRLPWVKGLLISFPFDEWVRQHGNCSRIKDIYGREYDIFKDDIQIILTKSQFKMGNFFKNWSEYQKSFLEFGCEAGICNIEDDIVDDACLSYQMIQTLTDLSDEELIYMATRTNYAIKNISSDRRTMLKAFGVKKSNVNKNYFQKSLELYPEMVSDPYTKNTLSEIKKKYVKQGRAGRLHINGKYTFISPDWYAMCESIFLNQADPVGLLENGEVFCSLFKNNERLDCLRSPHLANEHAVRENIYKDKPELSEWFCTGAVHTSCHDLISKILQFDCDGDASLVVADDTTVSAATRNSTGVVPLYYEMKKADACIVDNQRLYESMIAAYTGGNIGEISNCISKIWNSDDVDIGLIKCLCRYTNEVIDFAKTLYKSPLPDWLEQKIKHRNNQKLPYFFTHAKDKSKNQVQDINNSSVNRLEYIIQNPRFDFDETNTGKFNYRNLMCDQSVVFDNNNSFHTLLIDFYKLKIRENISAFNDLDGENGNHAYVYQQIRNAMIDEFGKVESIVDVLIAYFFGKVKSRRKSVLWGAFGDVLYENIKNNIGSDTFSCTNCGKRVKKIESSKRNAQKYCSECSSDIQYYKPIKTKNLVCTDCKKEFVADSKANNCIRCPDCQKKKQLEWQRKSMKKLRM